MKLKVWSIIKEEVRVGVFACKCGDSFSVEMNDKDGGKCPTCGRRVIDPFQVTPGTHWRHPKGNEKPTHYVVYDTKSGEILKEFTQHSLAQQYANGVEMNWLAAEGLLLG